MAQRKNFDSDFCGNLPLHSINSIQDYGYLLVADAESLRILQASENTQEISGLAVADFVGKNLADFVGADDIARIGRLLERGLKSRIPLNLSIRGAGEPAPYHALFHIKPEYILIELEKANEELERSFKSVFQEVKQVIAAIEEANTVQQVCDIAVHELRKISGFDGVLMYRFDEDWNGTVISEEKDERLDAYFGQTFPASDIPRQARELYLKNPYRLIPNRNYRAVRLYPVINPITNAFINLSDCNLRSVAAVHLEYMGNMNIKASMSIRVLHDEQLWGLISCHNIEEQYLHYEVCSVFEWLSQVISSRISLILNKERFEIARNLQEQRAELADRIYAKENINALLQDHENDVLRLLNASGAVLVQDGRVETKGLVPDRDELDHLLFWLEGKCNDKIFYSHHLSGIYEDASSFARVGSGMLVIPINSARGEYLICFRPELVEDIHWGGNPHQAIRFDEDKKNYHPRNSFQLWKETVIQHAAPWEPEEIEIASSLRNFLFEFRTRQLYN